MTSTAVARRYAGALVSLASEEKCLDAVAGDLTGFAGVLAASAELRSALTNPGFTADERRGVVGALLDQAKAHAISRNFLFVLVDNNRMAEFGDIHAAFGAAYDASKGVVRASVTSASPLTKTTITALEKQVKKLTGAKKVVLDTAVDASLIGGIVTRVGDQVLDGSVRTQLDNLRNSLLAASTVGEA